MKLNLLLPSLFRQAYAATAARLARHWKNSFYLYLAALFTLYAVGDAIFLHGLTEKRQGAFDMIVSNRIIVPQPDPDIIIVDINEASLAAMAPDYGRWPWQRCRALGGNQIVSIKNNPALI